MKYLSLFSGIGAFEKALDRLNINYKLVGYSDIDKYASRSYSAIHNVSENMNLGDITKINEKDLPKVLILKSDAFLSHEHLERVRNDIISQIKSGVCVIPSGFTCEIIDRDCLLKEENA